MSSPDSSRGPRGARGEGRVAVLLLAAGSSDRMGRNKMLFDLGGETVLRRAALTAAEAGPDLILVVTGHQHEEAEAQLDGIDCRTVHNPGHADGIHTSVRAGIEHLPDDIGAMIIMLADMPYVTASMLGRLMEAYRGSDAPLVISCYGGEVDAPPMLYDRSLFDELCVMRRRCGREVVKRHRDEALVMDWPLDALADLDTEEDYQRVREALHPHREAEPES